MKYKFLIKNYGQTIEDATIFESEYEATLAYIAENAANHFFNSCGGWEYSWPIIFSLYTAENIFLGQFEIELETVPEFTVINLRKKNDT